MPIKIISLKDGFRRCGVEHPAKPVLHPDGKFTGEQLKKLKKEPMLIIEEVSSEESSKKPGREKDDK